MTYDSRQSIFAKLWIVFAVAIVLAPSPVTTDEAVPSVEENRPIVEQRADSPFARKGVQLAAEIIEEMWVERPFGAAQGLCIDGWEHLARLGDEKARYRLEVVAQSDGKYADNATMALYNMGDESYLNRQVEVASDKPQPFSRRVKALAYYRRLKGNRLPRSVEDLCLECLESNNSDYVHLGMDLLRDRATERSRAGLERFAEKCIEGRGLLATEPDCMRYGWLNWAMQGISHMGSAPSRDLLVRVLKVDTRHPCSPVIGQAALELYRLGDTSLAVETLENAYAQQPVIRWRLGYAWALVSMGREQYRSAIRDAMDDPSPLIRCIAYLDLMRLGDRSFLAKATRDITNPRFTPHYNGILEIGARLRDTGIQGELACDYFLAMAEKAEYDIERAIALGRLANSGNERAARAALALCRDALEKEPPAAPSFAGGNYRNTAAQKRVDLWRLHLAEVSTVLRLGSPPLKQHAMEHLERMYDKAAHEPDARHDIVWSAAFKGLPVCQPFLERVMQETSPSDAQRLKAALGYLAAELERQRDS